jgi:single-strand DNA-binding protein
MPSFNTITIVGHLGRDPELRYTPQGKAVCDFSVATSEKFRDTERTTWFKVTAWDKTAESVAKYLRKGSLAYVAGRLSLEDWTDRDGKDRQTLVVSANDIKFLGGQNNIAETVQAAVMASETAKAPTFTGKPADDDIPF